MENRIFNAFLKKKKLCVLYRDTAEKFWGQYFIYFFKGVSYALQDCIYLTKNHSSLHSNRLICCSRKIYYQSWKQLWCLMF